MVFRISHLAASEFKKSERGNIRYWDCLDQGMPWPWFYLKVTQCQSDIISHDLISTYDPSLLDDLVRQNSTHRWLSEAYLATPSGMNSSSEWRLESLIEIIKGYDDFGALTEVNCKVESGAYYHLGGHITDDRTTSRILTFSAAIHIHKR